MAWAVFPIFFRLVADSNNFNDMLFWVDVNKEGAEQWIKGYVRYFKSLGLTNIP